MKFLLLNQTFHPDVVATAQYLTDLARALVERGHQVTVISGRRAYDSSGTTFPARESWNGIDIRRVRGTRFGKGSKLRRAADFASFIVACCWQLLFVPRPDVVVALTSPPLISFIAACYAWVRRCRFVYWVMDLNPDEAIAAGWLRESSFVTRALNQLSEFSLRRANVVVALDRFMRDRIVRKGIAAEKVSVLPPWSHDDAVRFDPAARETFRRAHGLDGKFVVMYSGNHSPCHPLDTVLEAARVLNRGTEADPPKDSSTQPSTLNPQPPIRFCFVGGGSEFAKVQRFATGHALTNITCLPYQPLSELSGSLSAADLHVVAMGNAFVGTIHPCKVYNVLAIGAPILYIGPRPSHVTEIFDELQRPDLCHSAEHEDVSALVAHIRSASRVVAGRDPDVFRHLSARFSKQSLLTQLLSLCEAVAGKSSGTAEPKKC